jgi:hypothetical protein
MLSKKSDVSTASPRIEVGGQDRDNRVTRIEREVPDAKPEGVTTVEVVANNIPSMWNEQLAQIGCDKKRSSKKVTAQQLSIVLMDISYTGRTVLALYETLVEGRPYRWVAERYGLKSDSFKVARSRVLTLITSLDKSHVG